MVRAIIAAAREIALSVPLVVRLEGTNVELGKVILAKSGLPIVSGSDLADAAQKIVKAVKGQVSLSVRGGRQGPQGILSHFCAFCFVL
jgi:succinyl-CoA synthetase beta subunit